MTTSGAVAIELRKLADSLDRQPSAVLEQAAVTFYCHKKDTFLAVAALLPRPLKKKVTDSGVPSWARVRLSYANDAIEVEASVPQSLTCELVEPAKPAVYRCESILSQIEDEALEVSA